MTRCLSLLIYILLSSIPAEARIWPQLVLGDGSEAVILISNLTNFDWDGQGSLWQGNEQQWSGQWSLNGLPRGGNEFQILLGPKATQKFVLSGDAELRSGYLEIRGVGSSSFDIAVSFFYNLASEGQTIDSIGASVCDSHRGWVFPVEKTPTINTGFAWAPDFTTTEFEIITTLYDDSGMLVETLRINFSGHRAEFVDQLFSSIGQNFIGMVSIESQSFFCVTVLRLEFLSSGFQLSNTPPEWFIP